MVKKFMISLTVQFLFGLLFSVLLLYTDAQIIPTHEKPLNGDDIVTIRSDAMPSERAIAYEQKYKWNQKVVFHPQPTFIHFELIERGYALEDGSNAILLVLKAKINPEKICYRSHHRVLHSLVEYEMGTRLPEIKNLPSNDAIEILDSTSDILLPVKTTDNNIEYISPLLKDETPGKGWSISYSNEGVASFYRSEPFNVKTVNMEAIKEILAKNETHFHDWVYDINTPGNSNVEMKSHILYKVHPSVSRFYIPIGFSLRWQGYQLHANLPVLSSAQWSTSTVIDVKIDDRLQTRQRRAPTLQFNPSHVIGNRGFSNTVKLNCF